MSEEKLSDIETQEKENKIKGQSMNMWKYNFQNCLNETEALYLLLNML